MTKKGFLTKLGLLAAVGTILASCNNGGSDKTYTLREFLSASPTCWNPHAWEMNTDTYIPGYCEMGFVDITYDPTNAGYKFVNEMADSITDVTTEDEFQTADFMTKWGIGATDTERVWEFKLNQGAKWQDGTLINADSYIESMKRDLDPKMKNYRANTYYTGDIAIQGAYNYFLSDSDNYIGTPYAADKIAAGATRVDQKVYLDWSASELFNESSMLGGMSPSQFATGGSYSSYFMSADKSYNLIDKYPDPVELTPEIKSEIVASQLNTLLFGGSLTVDDMDELVGAQLLHIPAASFDSVGLVKVDNYTFLYITASPVSQFNFYTNLTSNWLVNTTLYDAGYSQVGNLKTTNYGTNLDTYMSFGPYKLVSWQKDKQMKFEKNAEWYGWKDGKHEGQFQTTNITCDIIPEHATALLNFQKGELDSVDLETADLKTFGYSDYLLHTPETYTMRFVFDSNVTDLAALETAAGDGNNKKILAEKDFRKALSLAIDRKRFNAEGTAGNESAFGLLNSLYYYDVANNPTSIYRNTDVAKQAICDLYGMKYGADQTYKTLDEAYAAVTGFDLVQAKALFTSAYNAAIADGNYSANQAIKLQIGYFDKTTSTTVAQIALLNGFVAAATAGTPLEGKITFEAKSFNGDVSRYDAISSGSIEIANCAWGGGAFYPFSTLEVYTDASQYSLNEQRSFDPTNVEYTISYDFNKDGTKEDKKYTFYKWVNKLASSDDTEVGAKAAAGMDARLYALSRLEYGLLDRYDYAVVGSYATVSLFSKKIKYVTTTYNIMYSYGGIRYMTYNYDDASWTSYVKSLGGTIKYE